MHASIGDTFIGEEKNQATEKRTENIATWRQLLRQPSPLRGTNAREKAPSSSEEERADRNIKSIALYLLQHSTFLLDSVVLFSGT